MQTSHASFQVPDLPVPDLIRIRDEIDTRIMERRRADLAAAAERVGRVAAEFGFAVEDLIPALRGTGTRPVKYRHPDRPDLVWCGRGRRPHWLNEALKQGIQIAKIMT